MEAAQCVADYRPGALVYVHFGHFHRNDLEMEIHGESFIQRFTEGLCKWMTNTEKLCYF